MDKFTGAPLANTPHWASVPDTFIVKQLKTAHSHWAYTARIYRKIGPAFNFYRSIVDLSNLNSATAVTQFAH
jgi:hypothetical protein